MVKSLGCAPPLFIGVLAMGVLATCVATEPVPDDVLSREEARLLSPFEVEQLVVADVARVVMTGNFFDDFVQGALTPAHRLVQEVQPDGGMIYRYTNSSLTGEPTMQFTIANTTFAILKQFELQVLGGSRDWTLRAESEGVTVDRGGVRSNSAQFRIENGSYTRS